MNHGSIESLVHERPGEAISRIDGHQGSPDHRAFRGQLLIDPIILVGGKPVSTTAPVRWNVVTQK